MDSLALALDDEPKLDAVVADARDRLKGVQQNDGHWVFELEADATIPSEYILLKHFMAEADKSLEPRIGTYLRGIQSDRHGGWPLFFDGDFDISASVKAYYALKLIGDDPDAPHMRRAREAILAHGGAATSNVLTRYWLALFGQVPWRAVPVMMAEFMLLPQWFPFSLGKMSYWSRAVIVPLLILTALKPRARNPEGIGIVELFVTPPDDERGYNTNPTGSFWGDVLLFGNNVAGRIDPIMPKSMRRLAIKKALDFVLPRLNGENGLGAIFPAMANCVMALDALGYPRDHPAVVTAVKAIDDLLVFRDDGSVYCQPCLSPVWDTGLAAHALMEAGEAGDSPSIRRSMDWLRDRQILDRVGDWADVLKPKDRPRPGGWAFQYGNDFYPDVDDTAMVAMALHRTGDRRYEESVNRAAEWILGMQSKNGGWGAYDANNTHYYLNHIPFADHGALLDPPTADVTARCLGFLAQYGYGNDHPAVRKAIDYLMNEQEPDGSWFGRWGTNYVYGTWSVLAALNAVGMELDHPAIRRAVDWLIDRQRADGGWGEDCATYWVDRRDEVKDSTPSQTAWAVLALMAAGEVDNDATRRGIAYLKRFPRSGARWDEWLFNAVGFPRVFYLKYHGYAAYFPLWAVARYQRLMRKNDRRVEWGM